MNSMRQLYRQPVKACLGILLLALASAVLLVGVGQYVVSTDTQRTIDSQFTTVAVPGSRYMRTELTDPNGDAIGTTYLDRQPDAVTKLLARLQQEHPDLVQSVEHHGLISGYCEMLDPLNWLNDYAYKTGDASGGVDSLAALRNEPYDCAILIVRIEGISDFDQTGVASFVTEEERESLTAQLKEQLRAEGVSEEFLENFHISFPDPEKEDRIVEIVGTVLSVEALDRGYDDPTGYSISVTLRIAPEETFDALDLHCGDICMVFSTDYYDENLQMKQMVCPDEQAYRRHSWSFLRMLTVKEKRSLPINDHENMEREGRTEPVIAVYQDPESERETYLTQVQLDMIRHCRMTVFSQMHVYGDADEIQMTDGQDMPLYTVSHEAFDTMYRRAGIRKIQTTGDTPKDGDEAELWQQAREIAAVNLHAFPIIATDQLSAVSQFAMQDAIITEGRAFSDDDYRNGNRVCIVSETLAAQNGLEIGDRIPVRFYERDYNLPWSADYATSNPTARDYFTAKGFCGETQFFEIVGMYRQKQEWAMRAGCFTPNTIFVPKSSVDGRTETYDSGVFYSIVLKNGAADAVDAFLAENGYEGLLIYYDQGYADIAENLSAYFATAGRILLIGMIGWATFLAVFLLLFPLQQKRELVRMWTLGAPKSWTVRHSLLSVCGLAVPGTALGVGASAALLWKLLKRMQLHAGLQAASFPTLWFLGIAAIQTGLLLILTALIAFLMIRSAERRGGA